MICPYEIAQTLRLAREADKRGQLELAAMERRLALDMMEFCDIPLVRPIYVH